MLVQDVGFADDIADAIADAIADDTIPLRVADFGDLQGREHAKKLEE
jgi:hypothetical protein